MLRNKLPTWFLFVNKQWLSEIPAVQPVCWRNFKMWKFRYWMKEQLSVSSRNRQLLCNVQRLWDISLCIYYIVLGIKAGKGARLYRLNIVSSPPRRRLTPYCSNKLIVSESSLANEGFLGYCQLTVEIFGQTSKHDIVSFMIVYNYDADLEVSDTCVRSSLLSWVELKSNLKKRQL